MIKTPPSARARAMALSFVICALGCSGPFIEVHQKETYSREGYPNVVVVPFDRRGDVTAKEAETIRGWVELGLLREGFRPVSWSEVEHKAREMGGTDRETVLRASRDLGALAIWNARAQRGPVEDGRILLTLVLRLTEIGTQEWILEIRGHDEVDPPSQGEEVWLWRGLAEEMISEIP